MIQRLGTGLEYQEHGSCPKSAEKSEETHVGRIISGAAQEVEGSDKMARGQRHLLHKPGGLSLNFRTGVSVKENPLHSHLPSLLVCHGRCTSPIRTHTLI